MPWRLPAVDWDASPGERSFDCTRGQHVGERKHRVVLFDRRSNLQLHQVVLLLSLNLGLRVVPHASVRFGRNYGSWHLTTAYLLSAAHRLIPFDQLWGHLPTVNLRAKQFKRLRNHARYRDTHIDWVSFVRYSTN